MASDDDYGMKYAVSSEGLDVVYVGMRICEGWCNALRLRGGVPLPHPQISSYGINSFGRSAWRCNNGTLCCRSTILLYYVGSESYVGGLSEKWWRRFGPNPCILVH